MKIRNYLIFLFLLFISINMWGQNYFGGMTDLKVLVVISENSNIAAVMYSSGKQEMIDITTKLYNEINAYLELELWISKKTYLNGAGHITVYGNPEYVESYIENCKKR